MEKQAVRQVFEQIAACLELKGDNPFRIRAFENAARAVAAFPGDLAEGLQSGTLGEVRGVGAASLDIIRELLATGRAGLLDELREHIPPGLVEMLRIPGLGVAKVRQIHEQLGIESLSELEVAAADGRLAALPRFGTRTADKVRRGIAFLRQSSEFRLFHHAIDEARAVQKALGELEGVERVELAGSVRRCRELIRDLTLVVVHGGGRARDGLVKRLGEAPGISEVTSHDLTVTLRFASGTVVDVLLATPENLGLAWVRATGSPTHWEQLEARAVEHGVPLDGTRQFPDEASVYAALGLPWIPPELREGLDEVAVAAAGRLPRLVERDDLRGFLHCHTNYSDGTVSIAQWADACCAAGYEWIGITDHSESSAYAGGLRGEEIARQHAEIDAVNGRLDGCRVLKGVEADIMADGSLDYGPDLLDHFDFVIGSIHSRFGMTEAEMTERVLAAMEDHHLTILGHPTGRLLLSREPFAIDIERILERAAARGVAVEVNADPHRLDLDWRMVRRARDLGVTVSIGADAHSVAAMANVDMGVGIARKGWMEATQVLNTRGVEDFLTYARGRRHA